MAGFFTPVVSVSSVVWEDLMFRLRSTREGVSQITECLR